MRNLRGLTSANTESWPKLRRADPTVSGSVSGGTEGRYVTRQKVFR